MVLDIYEASSLEIFYLEKEVFPLDSVQKMECPALPLGPI